jgi:hypothetical protein
VIDWRAFERRQRVDGKCIGCAGVASGQVCIRARFHQICDECWSRILLDPDWRIRNPEAARIRMSEIGFWPTRTLPPE